MDATKILHPLLTNIKTMYFVNASKDISQKSAQIRSIASGGAKQAEGLTNQGKFSGILELNDN